MTPSKSWGIFSHFLFSRVNPSARVSFSEAPPFAALTSFLPVAPQSLLLLRAILSHLVDRQLLKILAVTLKEPTIVVRFSFRFGQFGH